MAYGTADVRVESFFDWFNFSTLSEFRLGIPLKISQPLKLTVWFSSLLAHFAGSSGRCFSPFVGVMLRLTRFAQRRGRWQQLLHVCPLIWPLYDFGKNRVAWLDILIPRLSWRFYWFWNTYRLSVLWAKSIMNKGSGNSFVRWSWFETLIILCPKSHRPFMTSAIRVQWWRWRSTTRKR